MPPPPISPTGPVPGDRLEDYGGLRLLVSDFRLVGKLLNEGRYQLTRRVFGVSREDSNLVTIVALAMLAAGSRRQLDKFMKGPPLPELGSVLLTGAGLGRMVEGVAGGAVQETPGFGALIVLAVVATSVRPVAARSWHEARAATHAARTGFDHRYGHIFRPYLDRR